ncbi:Uncharacterized conserved protein YndB, AHSA1/START domain [Prosthecobacter debontii]|uniref:Uncharacterized conserved protein YndB, AHSA1/START domain n=1 Tax=Prosthecobacter debontii TaxID=48467 RepID=A0A1T4XK70_9BACT|nr:SRPBCC domain-containing protein [Prosthecobacter debontii]SKA89813.1 Uncharacterized conserved protein YndB, AHSA1/START domain [Prosthecobacter debontii]
MNSSSAPSVCITRNLPFSPERVFDAWLDPTFAAKWLFATPEGEMIRAETDPRVGGHFTFTERRGGEDVEHTGEYLEISRPSRLVFTFGVPKYSADVSQVTVEIQPRGEGCTVTLTQTVAPQWAAFKHRSQLGWITILEGLAACLGDPQAALNRQPGDASQPGEVRFIRLMPGPIERVWDYLTDPDKRSQWFAGGPMELREGATLQLLFRHGLLSPDENPPEKYREVHEPGVPMKGRITQCEPPHRLGFTWEGETAEQESAVVFELFPEGNEVRLILTHRCLGSEHERADVSSGWHIHTAFLHARLSGNTPPPLWAACEKLDAEYRKRLHLVS